VAACRQRRRIRFTTAAALVNELVEAKHSNQLSRALGGWSRYELIIIDELGYVPLAEVGAELLFQVIADRAERTALIITTNVPFSEWPQVSPNACLCKAMLDRLTDTAHVIETGTESFRFVERLRKTGGSLKVGLRFRLTAQHGFTPATVQKQHGSSKSELSYKVRPSQVDKRIRGIKIRLEHP
jgi:hypothetical protein